MNDRVLDMNRNEHQQFHANALARSRAHGVVRFFETSSCLCMTFAEAKDDRNGFSSQRATAGLATVAPAAVQSVHFYNRGDANQPD